MQAESLDTLATKHDLLALAQQIDGLRGEVAQLATSLRSEMAQLATQLRAEMAQLATRDELAKLGGELAKLSGELHAEIHRVIGGSTRQMYMALLGHMAMTLGSVYFMITQLR